MIKNTLTKIIETHQESIQDEPRDYIGASSIGHECLRKIWYEFKGYKGETLPTKTRRIFDTGKILELLVVGWLQDSGLNISRSNKKYHAKNMEYFQGHFDGIIIINDIESILEIKTAKDASFSIFVNKGIMSWNNQYYSQIQAYMGMSNINSAYILVLNKDNSCLSDELISFDKFFYKQLQDKAKIIYESKIEPPRISGSPLWWKCKLCKFNNICHEI